MNQAARKEMAGRSVHSSRMARARHGGHCNRPMASSPRCAASKALGQQRKIQHWRGIQYNSGGEGKGYAHHWLHSS